MSTTLRLIFGVILYVLELALNIKIAFMHQDKWNYVFDILAILCCATLLVNIVTIYNRAGMISSWFYALTFVFPFCVILRYFEEWLVLKDDGIHQDREDDKCKKMIRVRFAQALLNSAPQCIIQGYIMVRLWSFPPFAIASLAISFISLLWGFASITPVDYSMQTFALRPQTSSLCSAGLFLFVRTVLMVSRLTLLVFFLHSFGDLSWAVLSFRMTALLFSAHSFVLFCIFCYLCAISSRCCGSLRDGLFIWDIIITLLVSFVDVTILSYFRQHQLIMSGWALHFLESIVMFCFQMWGDPTRPDNIDSLRFLTLRVFLGGIGISIFLSCVLFCCCDDDDDDCCTSRSSPQPSTNDVNHDTSSYAPATTSVTEDPLPPSFAGYVIKTERYPMDGVVVEKTKVYGIAS